MALRIGDVLVGMGALTREQVESVLAEQRRTGRPFGVIAERLFTLDSRVLDRAWAEQYAAGSPTVDPLKERCDLEVVQTVTRRQAWQFRLLPLRRDTLGDVMICTSKENLPRALRFAYGHFGPSCSFVVCDDERLLDALEKHHPMPGARERLMMAHA
ncbi:MAG: hypothetical protein K2Q09_06275 [Phycisphaerales bacterium]|nr:hypothetical protein [Phycisphaerales bacterium]